MWDAFAFVCIEKYSVFPKEKLEDRRLFLLSPLGKVTDLRPNFDSA